jgi:S1-C subfamily serine protease
VPLEPPTQRLDLRATKFSDYRGENMRLLSRERGRRRGDDASGGAALVGAALGLLARAARGDLGLGLRLVAIEGGGSGAMVMNVDPRGPGATAGVYQGDIVINWSNEPIRHVQSVLHALGPDSIGQTVTIGLHRAGETKQVSLTIAERPAA